MTRAARSEIKARIIDALADLANAWGERKGIDVREAGIAIHTIAEVLVDLCEKYGPQRVAQELEDIARRRARLGAAS